MNTQGNSRQIHFRVDEDLKRRFSDAMTKAKKDQSMILRELVEAAIRYVAAHGKIWPPFVLSRLEDEASAGNPLFRGKKMKNRAAEARISL